MYYGADIADSYRRVAYYVDRILRGAKPADLPVEQPTKFEFITKSESSEADRPNDSAQRAGKGG
jgi:putative ABC transport system substrate-binding protein